MYITFDKSPNKICCSLIHEILECINNVRHITYTPTSITCLLIEVEEVKQLIEPLKIKLEIKFNY